MANEEDLAILSKGVVAWNEWRDKNPDLRDRNLIRPICLEGTFVARAFGRRTSRTRTFVRPIFLKRTFIARI
jgi:hypothetical protein